MKSAIYMGGNRFIETEFKRVEEILKRANQLMTREELKKKLPTKIMHQTLNVILKYLEDSGKIIDGRKGLLWIYSPSSKLDKAIKEGLEL